jgi:hypothetical protein
MVSIVLTYSARSLERPFHLGERLDFHLILPIIMPWSGGTLTGAVVPRRVRHAGCQFGGCIAPLNPSGNCGLQRGTLNVVRHILRLISERVSA